MRTLSFLMMFGVVALLSGCADSETATEETPDAAAPAAADEDGHSHEGHDHEGEHADADGEQANHEGENADEAAVAMNANCPIMGKPVKADGGSADYNGKTVGFCCPGCVDKWTALSDEDKAKKLAETNPEGGEKPEA